MKIPKLHIILFHFLSIAFGFFVGIGIALLVKAGENQMLAAAAIVIGYGIITAVISFIVSFFLASTQNQKVIVSLNILWTLFISIIILTIFIRRERPRIENDQNKLQKKTQPALGISKAISLFPTYCWLNTNLIPNNTDLPMGMGIFKPNLAPEYSLYFYGNVKEQTVTDSISFTINNNGHIEISYAPPWLLPQNIKLDYGILLFKIKTIYKRFLEIEVNSKTHQTALINSNAGKVLLWPSFLLEVHSIELLPSKNNFIRSRPFEHSDKINIQHTLLLPLAIRGNWMKVQLVDDNYIALGEGWIKWNEKGQLLVKYSLLS